MRLPRRQHQRPVRSPFFFLTSQTLSTHSESFSLTFLRAVLNQPPNSSPSPPSYKIYTGHDYPPSGSGGGRSDPQAFSTVAEQRARNKHLREGVAEADFVAWRNERDATLAEPRLIHQAVQVNIRAGKLPAPLRSREGEAGSAAEGEGERLLHVPIRVAGAAGGGWRGDVIHRIEALIGIVNYSTD
ncbi:hypothetical protein VTK26DRAFT_9231 [Humicola hyalothermophila]